MQTFTDRFRRWYEYERDCNAKMLAMLESVPGKRRDASEFQRAVNLAAHLAVTRQIWLSRLGHWAPEPAVVFPSDASLSDLPELFQTTEAAWRRYLSALTDEDLDREFDYRSVMTGEERRYHVEGALTHLFGHASYHRAQISLLVDLLGGETVDTDYSFWKPAA